MICYFAQSFLTSHRYEGEPSGSPATSMGDLPSEVLIENVFPKLAPRDQAALRQVCGWLYQCSLEFRKRRALEFQRIDAATRLFSHFGITYEPGETSRTGVFNFLVKIKKCLDAVGITAESPTCQPNIDLDAVQPTPFSLAESAPDPRQPSPSSDDFVLTLSPHCINALLQEHYNRALRQAFGAAAHVPHDLSAEARTSRIATWLSTTDLSHVSRIALSGRGLTCFPKELLWHTGLSQCVLPRNRISCLPAGIGFLQNMRTLILNNNRLKNLPREIGNLKNLRLLAVNNNELRSLPCEIGDLSSLRILSLDDNQIGAVPATIGHLARLKVLCLGGNRLTSLPEEIGTLRCLIRLNLDRNRLAVLPEWISRLRRLQGLWLEHNLLTGVPDGLTSLRQLTTLRLAGNPLVRDDRTLRTLGALHLSYDPCAPSVGPLLYLAEHSFERMCSN